MVVGYLLFDEEVVFVFVEVVFVGVCGVLVGCVFLLM